MRYSHRLVGYDPAAKWSAPALDNKVSYNDLPTGEYRFEVRTQDREGVQSEVARLEVQCACMPAKSKLMRQRRPYLNGVVRYSSSSCSPFTFRA